MTLEPKQRRQSGARADASTRAAASAGGAEARAGSGTLKGRAAPDLLYWALGGGHGHAVRGLAVLSRLRRRQPALRAVLAAPTRHARWCATLGVELWSPPEGAREREPLAAWAASLPPPRLLVADVFPRGVLGELTDVLPRLERRPLLVSRRVRPRAWLAREVRAAIEERFAEVLWCEEPPAELAALSVPQTRVAPILSLPPGECLDSGAARDALGLAGSTPLVVMLGAGSEEEQRDTLRLLLKVQARLTARGASRFDLLALSPVLTPVRQPGLVVLDHFPAMQVLRAGTLVVSGGGYSAWHEARALGLPALHLPRPRTWDDQHRRVAGSDPPTSPEALEAAIERGLHAPRPPEAGLADGADRVALRLLEALS